MAFCGRCAQAELAGNGCGIGCEGGESEDVAGRLSGEVETQKQGNTGCPSSGLYGTIICSKVCRVPALSFRTWGLRSIFSTGVANALPYLNSLCLVR